MPSTKRHGPRPSPQPAAGPLRAVIYPRVSSDAQRDQQTVQNQLRSLPAYVEQRGWELVKPPETYVDDGRSAKTGQLEKRLGWARLIRDAEAGLFDVVTVVGIDRLTRTEDMAERGLILGSLQRAGVKIADASSGQLLDLNSSMGDLFSQLQAFYAAEDNRRRAERSRAGKARAIAEGRKPSGPTPFGLVFDRRAGWSLHPTQSETVREVFRRVIGGETCTEIARDLRARGVTTSRGKPMSAWFVWNMTKSPTYVGRWLVNREDSISIPVPRTVSDEDYAAAQAQFARTRIMGLRRTRHFYMLEGLMVCELCGSPIRIRTGSQKARHYPTYVCARRFACWFVKDSSGRDSGERCALPPRKVEETDLAVWQAFVEQLTATDLVDRMLARRDELARADRDTWADDLVNAKAALAASEKASAAILDRFRRHLISEATMDAELQAAARERTMLQRQIDTAIRASTLAGETKSRTAALLGSLKTIRRNLGRMKPDERRALVAELLVGTKITVGPDQISGVAHYALAAAVSRTGSGSRVGSRGELPARDIGNEFLLLPLVA